MSDLESTRLLMNGMQPQRRTRRTKTSSAPAKKAAPQAKYYPDLGPARNDVGYFLFSGPIRAISSNVARLLRLRGDHFQIKYNEFARQAWCWDGKLEDRHLREITEWVQNHSCHASIQIVQEAVERVADENRFNPVKDYLTATKWDGVDRLDSLLIDHAGAEDNAINRAFTSRWMIQAVNRIMEPGCQADHTLVLEGPQGLGKSSFLQVLFGPKWFSNSLPDVGTPEAKKHLRGVWVVELGELASMNKTDTATMKDFLTTRIDKYRDTYGRTQIEVPRSCVFAGTVNPGPIGYFKDDTGGRRYWPIALTKSIDVAEISRLRDRVWAEALIRYSRGEKPYLHESALVKIAAEVQEERLPVDPWLEIIEDFVQNWKTVDNGQILTHILGESSLYRWKQHEQARVGQCMKVLGWERFQRREGNRRIRGYRRMGSHDTKKERTDSP